MCDIKTVYCVKELKQVKIFHFKEPLLSGSLFMNDTISKLSSDGWYAGTISVLGVDDTSVIYCVVLIKA